MENAAGIVSVFEEVAKHIEQKSDHLIPAVRRRMSCEQWVHMETCYVLEQLLKTGRVDAYEPEHQFKPGVRRERCDVWFRIGAQEAWVEFQSIVTNYGSSGKPITNEANHVIEDAERLAGFVDAERAWLFCVVYPLASDGGNDLDWQRHLTRILQQGSLARAKEWRMPLDQSRSAIAYLFTLTRGPQTSSAVRRDPGTSRD